MMGRVNQGDARSSERLKRLSIAREKENQRKLAAVEKSLSEALKENGEIKNALKRVEKDNVKLSSDKDALKNELGVVKEDLAKVTCENERLQQEVNKTKGENEKLKEYTNKINNENEAMRKKMQTDSENHAKEEFELKRQLKEVKGTLTSERSKNLHLGKALAIHTDVNSRREKHNAEVKDSEEIAREAKRSREAFEESSAVGTRKVNEAVGLLEKGRLADGKKLINEIEETLEEEKKRWRKEKRERNRANKREREGDEEGANGSFLLVGGEGDGDGAHGSQLELST